ncbi:MAG TPA: NAD-dependent epimerase [Gemmatimonadales bacterium]|nr:NAD-dependent epimerase [Gemmatimonadales bacterium]
MRILLTGIAGFIGFHVATTLLERGDEVVGLDNLNSYYDVRLKKTRLSRIARHSGFSFVLADLSDRDAMERTFAATRPERVIHLGGQAGVRHSISDPHPYVQSNVLGFLHVLEGCREHRVDHLVFASSSSVHGANAALPWSVHQGADHPLSFYAATKKSNELMAHAYAHVHQLPVTGLRFFTVYGPWDRPDMAMYKFASAIVEGRPLDVYNEGRMRRDFTYVGDVVDGVIRALDHPARPNPAWSGSAPDPATSAAPYRLYNIGSGRPTELLTYITLLEEAFGKRATTRLLPMQPGDAQATWADIEEARVDLGYAPRMPLEEGIRRYAAWFKEYYLA